MTFTSANHLYGFSYITALNSGFVLDQPPRLTDNMCKENYVQHLTSCNMNTPLFKTHSSLNSKCVSIGIISAISFNLMTNIRRNNQPSFSLQ